MHRTRERRAKVVLVKVAVVVAILFSSAVAIADPTDPAPQGSDASQGSAAAPPASPPPSPPPPTQPTPVVVQAPGTLPSSQAPPRDPYADQHGFTFEANLGVGLGLAIGGGATSTSSASLAGLDLGFGGWLVPRLALTFRISGVDLGNVGPATVVDAFVGPSFQYWTDPHVWLGFGAGLALFAATGDCDGCVAKGFAADLRFGYSFGDGPSRFDISAEITPAFYDSASLTGFALLIGYQHL
jgi:hypothetical protein